MTIKQTIFGWFNNQKVVNNNIIVDEKYLRQLLSFENNPSDLNEIVLILYSTMNEDDKDEIKRSLPPDIVDKIEFNNVVSNRPIIENNYSENGYFLDNAYEALDSDTPGRKKEFLKYINMLYLTVLGDYIKKEAALNNELILSKIEIIRKNADNIIIEIINKLLLRIAKNSKLVEHISVESIECSVITIVCHAFVDCKVLENPNTL